MRIIFGLFCLFVSTLNLLAQEIVVNYVKENPLYELTETEIKKDANGDVCALICVYFSEDNAIFEGSYVVGSEKQSNLYHVFVAGGAKSITIKHDNYLPLNITFSNFNINRLESNKVYTIELIADKTINAFNKDEIETDYLSQAEAGDANAQYKLGKQYYSGINQDQDYKKAFLWFKKSAEQGNIDALYNSGLCYYFGYGININ